MKQERGSIGAVEIVLVVIVAVLAVFVLYRVFGGKTEVKLSTGETVVLNGDRLTPENSPELMKVRSDSVSKINAYFDEIEASTDMRVSRHISTDEYCNYGENNWKRSDPYKEQCEFQKTKYYGFSGDFASVMPALHEQLVELGWDAERTQGSLERLVEEYYIPIQDKTNSRGQTFDVSGLPRIFDGYIIDESAIGIAFAERSTNLEFDPFNNRLMVNGAIFTVYYRNENLVDYRLPVEELTEANEYVMAVSISDKYYQQ